MYSDSDDDIFNFGEAVPKYVRTFSDLESEYDDKKTEYLDFLKIYKSNVDCSRVSNSKDLAIKRPETTIHYKSCLLNTSSVLNHVLKHLPIIRNGEKYKIIEIDANRGEHTQSVVSRLRSDNVSVWISTDCAFENIFNCVRNDAFFKEVTKPNFSIGLIKSRFKNLKQEHEHKVVTDRRELEWYEKQKSAKNAVLSECKANGTIITPFPVKSAKMNVFDVINKIKVDNLTNSILFVAYPKRVEYGRVSSDIVMLMESLHVEQIKYVIIVCNTGGEDGSSTFYDDMKLICKTSLWNNIFHENRIARDDGFCVNYNRNMYVFSRNKTRIPTIKKS